MKLEFDILTLFPEMVEGFLSSSMMGRAQSAGIVRAEAHQLREWANGKHRKTDEIPYGGGAGMVMKPEPIFEGVEALRREESKVIYLAPDGERLTSEMARELATEQHLILLSGHYEGVDQRVRDTLVDREVSVGDYVLTNGTLAAAILIDCVSRFLPGFLGDEKILDGRILHGHFSRLSAIHTTAGVSGAVCTRGSPLGRSCCDCKMAA